MTRTASRTPAIRQPVHKATSPVPRRDTAPQQTATQGHDPSLLIAVADASRIPVHAAEQPVPSVLLMTPSRIPQRCGGTECSPGGCNHDEPPPRAALCPSRLPPVPSAAARIHTDAAASAATVSVDAEAYATGHDIYFRAGSYQPNSAHGRWLLLHELAHVAQQEHTSGPASSNAELEREADEVARQSAVGRLSRVRRSAPPSVIQCQPMSWKTSSDVHVNQLARQQIMSGGGLFSGNDQQHITVSAGGVLTYDTAWTAPEDPFRWAHLKDVVDGGHLKIAAVGAADQFAMRDAPGTPPVQRSITEIRIMLNDLSVMGITLRVGGQSADPTYDMIFYEGAQGVGALSHELFGHEWLAVRGAPSVHPPAGSAEEAAKGTIGPANMITDPFGNVYSGTVRAYIAKYAESLGSSVKVTTSAGQATTVPRSPTQGVGATAYSKAFTDLAAQAGSGLSKTRYSGPVAQAWRGICNNYDLMQTRSALTQARAQGASAAQTDFTYSKEQVLARALALFSSWSADQQSGFRIMLADFNGSKAGFSVNECSQKTEQLVGAAPSIFMPGSSQSPGGTQQPPGGGQQPQGGLPPGGASKVH